MIYGFGFVLNPKCFDMEVKKVWNWFDEYVASMNLKTSLLWIFQNTLRTPTTTGLSISVCSVSIIATTNIDDNCFSSKTDYEKISLKVKE